LYPFSQVGSNPLWADGGLFLSPFTEPDAPFCLPGCPQRDTLTLRSSEHCMAKTLISIVKELTLEAAIYNMLINL
jgi:hypothetical protein